MGGNADRPHLAGVEVSVTVDLDIGVEFFQYDTIDHEKIGMASALPEDGFAPALFDAFICLWLPPASKQTFDNHDRLFWVGFCHAEPTTGLESTAAADNRKADVAFGR